MKMLRKFLSYVVIALLCIAAFLGAFAINERFFTGPPSHLRDDALRGGVNMLELYPYTGFHVQANYHHVGPLPEKQPYEDFDIKTGDLGFFDFKLDEAYPKKPNEFRIIWIGGSGAQGWGARTNDDMMYRKIPRYLTEKLKACNIEVSMFNLAMASSKSYQNFVALNLWGRRLNPDMIISYSGRNDVNVPFNHANDAYFAFEPLNAYVVARRPASEKDRGLTAWLSRTFPKTFENTQLGTALRLLFSHNYYYAKSIEDYRINTHKGPYPGAPQSHYLSWAESYFQDVVKPDYAHALTSIKRDFGNIPMVVAWQPVTQKEWEETGLARLLGENFYTRWFESLPEEFSKDAPGKWYFYDVDSFMKNHVQENTGTHQGNAGQELISVFMSQKLAPVIAGMKAPGCKVAF